MKIFFFFVCLSFPLANSAQTLTPKDFKLCLDDLGCSDSTLHISKETLLKASKVTANFSWLAIKSLTIYIGWGNYTSEIMTVSAKGDTISNEARKLFKRMGAGGLVTIGIEGYNKKGQRIDWSSLSIIIKE